MRLTVLVPLVAALLAGCGGVPPVSPAMVASAGGVSERVLNDGRNIYGGRCTSCHAPDSIGKYSLPRWREITEDMAPRAKLRPEQKAALMAYLEAAHRMPGGTAR